MKDPFRIFLLGFMGSGKSFWGKRWAEKHQLTFYDLDQIIQEIEGTSINEIFSVKGEEYFRTVESRALKTFAFQDNFILACGGGTPCFYDNMDWMNAHGITVYLNTTPETIVERLASDSAHRPLIKQMDKKDIIDYTKESMARRVTYYLRSALIIPEEKQNDTSLSILNI